MISFSTLPSIVRFLFLKLLCVTEYIDVVPSMTFEKIRTTQKHMDMIYMVYMPVHALRPTIWIHNSLAHS